jgi:hypothetical protein
LEALPKDDANLISRDEGGSNKFYGGNNMASRGRMMALGHYIKHIVSTNMFKVEITLIIYVGMFVSIALVEILVALVAASPTKGWSG